MTKQSKRNKWKEYSWGYGMIAPLVAGLCVFYFYPIIKVFWDSLHEVGAFNKTKWVGIANFTKMMQDSTMWESLGNTLQYVIIIVPVTIVLSLVLASLLNMGLKGTGFFRVIYFIPTITMGAAVAMIWRWIFNGDFGILNYLLKFVGIAPKQYLSNPQIALYSICVVAIWQNVGYYMIIILAGIQGISKTYYEAASIDGATDLQQFFKITVPLVTPTLFFVMITSLISTFQTFDTIFMMIQSQSLAMESTQSLVVYFYRNAFMFSKKGYASAIAVFLFLIIMVITAFQMKIQKLWVNYD